MFPNQSQKEGVLFSSCPPPFFIKVMRELAVVGGLSCCGLACLVKKKKVFVYGVAQGGRACCLVVKKGSLALSE